MTLPRLDPYLSSIGEELEDLSRIGSAQPFRSAGPTLPREDLVVLAQAARARLRKVRATPTLEAAGLMGTDGLTDDGRTVAALLTAPEGQVRVESGRGRAPLTLDVSIRAGLALAVSTASPATLDHAPRGAEILDAAAAVGLDVLDVAAVPALVASWVGLAPAWSLATEPRELPEEAVLGRVDDDQRPAPVDADPHLRHAWEQPWFMWTIRASNAAHGLVVVNAGVAGSFALTSSPRAGYVGFMAVPAAVVWSRLVALVAAAAVGPS